MLSSSIPCLIIRKHFSLLLFKDLMSSNPERRLTTETVLHQNETAPSTGHHQHFPFLPNCWVKWTSHSSSWIIPTETLWLWECGGESHALTCVYCVYSEARLKEMLLILEIQAKGNIKDDFIYINLFLKQKAKWTALTSQKARRTTGPVIKVLHGFVTKKHSFSVGWRPRAPFPADGAAPADARGPGGLNTVILRVVLESLFMIRRNAEPRERPSRSAAVSTASCLSAGFWSARRLPIRTLQLNSHHVWNDRGFASASSG